MGKHDDFISQESGVKGPFYITSNQGEHIDRLKGKFCNKFKIKRLEHGRDLRKQKVKDKDGKPANENEKEAEKDENKNIPLDIAEGYKIVDVEFLVSQLKEGCKTYKKEISLCNIEEETKIGLAYLFYMTCLSCRFRNKLYTSRSHANVFDINTVCATGKYIFFMFKVSYNNFFALIMLTIFYINLPYRLNLKKHRIIYCYSGTEKSSQEQFCDKNLLLTSRLLTFSTIWLDRPSNFIC